MYGVFLTRHRYQSSKYAANRLGSLAERDETPTNGTQSNLNAIVSSPVAPRTPATAGKPTPSMDEMHPSKAHHSTTLEPDSGLRLGFTDINARRGDQPSGVTQQTPSKEPITSPSFDFQFARPGPQLGPEAQLMMDNLREEALRIKAKLAAEREEEKRKTGEDGIGGRKIAQPKGKAGRFSDIHMAEFKKMDSIAGHPSSFRAQPGRFTPVTNTLKRTQSKARLDEREEMQIEENNASAKRLENTAPAKRARQNITDDTSSTRPVSRDGSQAAKPMPTTPRSQSNLPSSITTPTQASLSRAASVKNIGSQIPMLSRSPSKPNLVKTPRGLPKSATATNISSLPRSESKGFLRSPGKFDRVKSILRYPSSSKKPTAIPSLTRSPSKPNLEKALPSLPTTPVGLDRSKSAKHVNFTPDTINKHVTNAQTTPSPIKSGIPRSTSKINFGLKTHFTVRAQPKEGVQYPSIAGHPSVGDNSQEVAYPDLASLRPLPQPPRQAKLDAQPPPPSVPGTFTFRSDHTINFGASPEGFGSSPGQASIRQVRQSIVPSTMPGSFPGPNKENVAPLPSVPHGIANKKRCRADSDDEREVNAERSPKKHKSTIDARPAPSIIAEIKTPQSKNATPAKKKILSLSRLNMLARPKMRK